MGKAYHDKINKLYTAKLRVLMGQLPYYCKYFFDAKAHSFEVRSRWAYAMDLKVFFEFIKQSFPEYSDIPIKEIPPQALDTLSSHDIDAYLEFLKDYKAGGQYRANSDSGQIRKLASLKTFFKYLSKEDIISRNPAALVDSPKMHGKDVIALTPDEKAKLLHVIDTGDGMSEHQKKIHKFCRERDKAMVMLMLGTGIRVSELVGLDISDIDFDNRIAHVIRKGGSKDHVYFSEQVKDALYAYYRPGMSFKGTRASFNPDDNETALFISRKKGRLTVRAVQKILQTYSKVAFGIDVLTKELNLEVSPHKLRKTYGTELYQKKEDIQLVADTLGHKNVNTTSKHYIAKKEEHKKLAAIDVM